MEGIVVRQGKALDAAYVRRWLDELARIAEDPEVASRFERVCAERGTRAPVLTLGAVAWADC